MRAQTPAPGRADAGDQCLAGQACRDDPQMQPLRVGWPARCAYPGQGWPGPGGAAIAAHCCGLHGSRLVAQAEVNLAVVANPALYLFAFARHRAHPGSAAHCRGHLPPQRPGEHQPSRAGLALSWAWRAAMRRYSAAMGLVISPLANCWSCRLRSAISMSAKRVARSSAGGTGSSRWALRTRSSSVSATPGSSTCAMSASVLTCSNYQTSWRLRQLTT